MFSHIVQSVIGIWQPESPDILSLDRCMLQIRDRKSEREFLLASVFLGIQTVAIFLNFHLSISTHKESEMTQRERGHELDWWYIRSQSAKKEIRNYESR